MSTTASTTSYCENSTEDDKFQDIHVEPSCDSLLMVLDDKNRIIATLRKQLQNQKVQLAYYLKRELTSPKILQLSQSCSPQASEESMAVNLALNKFYRQMGLKSNVYSLYERMSFIDEKIDTSLHDQEFILRKIVNKLCDFVKNACGKIEFKVQFSNFVSDPFHLGLFNELLNATLNLRKKLDTFRICCNRLMVIEEERNSIVEQIYSLPPEQRMNCNYLISTQMEKTQLENEIKLILKEQGKDRARIKDLNIIEEKLSTLQAQLNSSFMRNDETSRINKMLQKVNAEAKILLELTKEQRTRYEKEMLRVRRQKNVGLERMLVCVRTALESKEISKRELLAKGISGKEDMQMFEYIKKEIEVAKDKYTSTIIDELQMKRQECERLKIKLNRAMLDRNELKIFCAQLQRDISDIKYNQKNDLSNLKEERDAYKSQVEDLEAIREAYAQLVDRQPTTSKIEKEYMEQIYDRNKQIDDLGRVNRSRLEELNKLKSIISMQTKELTRQGEIIEELKEQHAENIKNENKKTRCVFKKASNVDSGINSSPRDTMFSDESLNNHIDNGRVKYNEIFEQEIFLEEEIINWIEEVDTSVPTSFHAKNSKNNMNSNYEKQTTHVVENIKNHKTEKVSVSENETSFRCFKIISKKQGKVSDVLEAVIKTSVEADLQSHIKMESESSFCLEINYKPKQSVLPTSEVKDEKCEIDDYELMKDCSRESIPTICQPRKEMAETKYSRENLGHNFSFDSSFTEQMSKRLEILKELESTVNASSEEYVHNVYAYKSQTFE